MAPRSLTLTYPRTPINTVNRYNVRETYDLAKIHSIINEASVLHITLNAPGEAPPTNAPLNISNLLP